MTNYTGPYPGNDFFKSFTKTWHTKPSPSVSPSRPELSAAGKVIFITGGGSGIGKATAIAFAQASAKAIAIFGRRPELLQSAAEEIRKASPNNTTTVVTESVDISHRAALEVAFADALKRAGGAKIDVFVSSAGSLKPPNTIAKYSEQDFRDAIDTNLIGTFNGLQVVLPLLAHDAKVLNISSGIGHVNPLPGYWAYATLKLGITKMFDYLQFENPNISVFNVQPGVVTTELNSVSGFPGQDDRKSGVPLIKSDESLCVLLLIGIAAELPGHFHVWLASPEAVFLKGKFVWVNWDVDELKAHAKEIQESMLLRIDLDGVQI